MIRFISFALLVIALGSLCAVAFCADTLTFKLEAPGLESSSAGVSHDTASVASKPDQASTAAIGRVGTVRETSGIYRKRSIHSHKYITVKAQTPLAIVKEDNGWYGVLMVNGLTGWISAKSVDMTSYELVAKKSDVDRGSLVSRAGDPERFGAASDLIKTAMSYSGVRYVFGGTNPATGMDCSAFVRRVFEQYGVNLPRTAREQAEVGTTVPFDQLQAGDRLYFQCNNPYIDHCGIYAGNGYFVHCSASQHGVAVGNLASDFYGKRLVTAKRS